MKTIDGRQLYDVTFGYWKQDPHVLAVTDDLLWARSYVLAMAEVNGMTREQFMCFERLFAEFEDGGGEFGSLYFSISDYHYCIRPSQVRLVVGGMSTI